MQGVSMNMGAAQWQQANRVAEPPKSVNAAAVAPSSYPGCTSGECSSADTRVQAAYQSVVLVLKERFSVSAQAPVPVAGLSPAERADNQLASTVGAALNSSPDTGPGDIAAATEAGLSQALGTAAPGTTDAAGIADVAADIRRRVQSLVAAFIAGRETEGVQSATSAKVTTRERGVLEIRTLEGDVVKIDFRTSTRARLDSATDGAGSSSDSLKVRVSERTSLSVQGDLSAEELQSIGDLVRKVDALANEFFAGNVEQAFAAAASVGIDSSQLASYSLRLSMSQQVRVRTTEFAVAPAPVPAEVEPASLPASVAEGVVPPPATPLPVAQASTDSPAVPQAAAPEETAPVSPAPADTTATPASVQEIIGQFVAKLRMSLVSSASDTALGFTSSVKLKILISAIESHTQSTPQTPAAAASLAEVAEGTIK